MIIINISTINNISMSVSMLAQASTIDLVVETSNPEHQLGMTDMASAVPLAHGEAPVADRLAPETRSPTSCERPFAKLSKARIWRQSHLVRFAPRRPRNLVSQQTVWTAVRRRSRTFSRPLCATSNENKAGLKASSPWRSRSWRPETASASVCRKRAHGPELVTLAVLRPGGGF